MRSAARTRSAGDADRHRVGPPPRAAAGARAELSIEPLRGNIDTRLRKRGERGLDAIVLAACGLDRLGLGGEIGARFDPGELLPEAAQGALALQVRAGEEELAAAVDDAETRRRVEPERALRRDDRRRLPRTRCRASRRHVARRAGRRRGRRVGRAPKGDDPEALGHELAALAAAS